jgi:hypothetical protein
MKSERDSLVVGRFWGLFKFDGKGKPLPKLSRLPRMANGSSKGPEWPA